MATKVEDIQKPKEAITNSKSVVPRGSREVAMNDNRNVYAQLQQMNTGLTGTGINSEFLQKLRREGGNGGLL